MFNWQARRQNLDPTFRAVYALQFGAALALLAGLFLVWWQSTVGDETAFDLLERSLSMLRARDPNLIGQPLIGLWLIAPALLIGLLRGLTGLLVTPVSYRILALVACGALFFALAHYWISFGSTLEEHAPLKDGRIGIGFWLSGAAAAILLLLLLTEGLIRPTEDPFRGQRETGGPVDDVERLWQGDYQTCPHCGMLNQPGARRCFQCNNLLFSFREKD